MDCVGILPSQFRADVCSEGQVLQIGQFSQSVCATILESHCQNNDLSLFISKDSSFVAMDDVITPSESIALKHCDSDEPAIIKVNSCNMHAYFFMFPFFLDVLLCPVTDGGFWNFASTFH